MFALGNASLMQTVMPFAVSLVRFLYPRSRAPAECVAELFKLSVNVEVVKVREIRETRVYFN